MGYPRNPNDPGGPEEPPPTTAIPNWGQPTSKVPAQAWSQEPIGDAPTEYLNHPEQGGIPPDAATEFIGTQAPPPDWPSDVPWYRRPSIIVGAVAAVVLLVAGGLTVVMLTSGEGDSGSVTTTRGTVPPPRLTTTTTTPSTTTTTESTEPNVVPPDPGIPPGGGGSGGGGPVVNGVECPDGSRAPSIDECPPIEEEVVECPDGSTAPSIDECPPIEEEVVECPDGSTAPSIDECPPIVEEEVPGALQRPGQPQALPSHAWRMSRSPSGVSLPNMRTRAMPPSG